MRENSRVSNPSPASLGLPTERETFPREELEGSSRDQTDPESSFFKLLQLGRSVKDHVGMTSDGVC